MAWERRMALERSMKRLVPYAIIMDDVIHTIVAVHGTETGGRRWVSRITILRDGEEVILQYPSEDYEPLFELVTIEDVLSYTYQAGWFDGDGWIEGDLA